MRRFLPWSKTSLPLELESSSTFTILPLRMRAWRCDDFLVSPQSKVNHGQVYEMIFHWTFWTNWVESAHDWGWKESVCTFSQWILELQTTSAEVHKPGQWRRQRAQGKLIMKRTSHHPIIPGPTWLSFAFTFYTAALALFAAIRS